MNVNNIRSPNYFIARWFLVFGIVFSAVLFISVSVKADVIMKGNKNFPSYAFHESYNDKQNIHNLNVLLEKAKNEGYNILICSGDYYDTSYTKNLKPYWILISNEPLNYDGVNFYTNNSSTCEYFNCTLVVSDTDEYSNVNNISNSSFEFKTNFSSKISKQYYPTVLYYNFPSGLNVVDNADTSFFPENYVDINKDDVNTYPVGHLEIVNPSGALNINYSNKYNAYPVDVKVKGKIPFQIKFGQESEISADKVKAILQKEMYNTMDFTMIGSNNTYTRSDKTFLGDNDPKLVVFGTKSDWIDNEYLTFEYTFKLYLKDKRDYNFKSFTINVPTWWEHTFFGIGTDKFKDFKADDVKFSINAYKDLNGDGVDDETGEVIPPQTDLDVDDDDWDHMTFLEKAEYLITSIPSFLGNIFDSLINTIANTVQLVNSVVAQGGTIAGIVTNLFSFFPAPIPQMITVTIGVMIFITFLSWVKK